MLRDILILAGLTLIPGLELRASIPYGILGTELSLFLVIAICLIVNALLGPVVFVILRLFVNQIRKIDTLDRLYNKAIARAQRKIHKYVEKYGVWGLSLFIGIPLPGSGSYTGALGAYVLGMDLKKFALANLVGVLIAATAVTLVVISGSEVFHLFIKVI